MSERSHRWTPPSFKQIWSYLGSIIVVVILFVAGFWGSHLLAPRHSTESDETAEEAAAARPEASVVNLTSVKLEQAGIHVVEAEQRDVQETRTVAATIAYDTTRYVELVAPVDCVVDALLVKPGQMVKQAESLAILSSSEVALSRAQVSNCEADLRLAQIHYDWNRETRENLLDLLETLKEHPTVEQVESKFNDRTLGQYRNNVLASYGRLLLARSVVSRTTPLRDQGIVAGRAAESRLGQLNEASTAFKTACEQSEYESRQELTESEAELEVAKRQLAVAQERLKTLLGPFGEEFPSETQAEFYLKAPFAGRIEVLHAAQSARIEKGEPTIVLADPNRLRVSAMIHQHDWEALKIEPGETVQFSVPAFPGELFPATVSFIGPEISPTTRAVSLVAVFDNQDGRFRPGMFAWVSVPLGAPRRALAVPVSAIQRHESETFVFVQDEPLRFRRVSVETSHATADYVEIVKGLQPSELVVDRGAFYLKSELLLEREED
jgi:cobalt-zinc-cadmium efflux system membrane fusion protein